MSKVEQVIFQSEPKCYLNCYYCRGDSHLALWSVGGLCLTALLRD